MEEADALVRRTCQTTLCQYVVDLFMRYYIEAIHSGMRTANYMSTERFGEYQKARLTNLVTRDVL